MLVRHLFLRLLLTRAHKERWRRAIDLLSGTGTIAGGITENICARYVISMALTRREAGAKLFYPTVWVPLPPAYAMGDTLVRGTLSM